MITLACHRYYSIEFQISQFDSNNSADVVAYLGNRSNWPCLEHIRFFRRLTSVMSHFHKTSSASYLFMRQFVQFRGIQKIESFKLKFNMWFYSRAECSNKANLKDSLAYRPLWPSCYLVANGDLAPCATPTKFSALQELATSRGQKYMSRLYSGELKSFESKQTPWNFFLRSF